MAMQQTVMAVFHLLTLVSRLQKSSTDGTNVDDTNILSSGFVSGSILGMSPEIISARVALHRKAGPGNQDERLNWFLHAEV